MNVFCLNCENEFDATLPNPRCPHCNSMSFTITPFKAISFKPVRIYDRDIFAGVELAYEKYRAFNWIETSRLLREQGYWKTSSWIENNRDLYEKGMTQGFTYNEMSLTS